MNKSPYKSTHRETPDPKEEKDSKEEKIKQEQIKRINENKKEEGKKIISN